MSSTTYPAITETALAVIERPAIDLVIIRYRPGAVLDEVGIGDVISTCGDLPGLGVFSMVTVMPVDAEVSMRVLQRDYFTQLLGEGRIRALAVVSPNDLFFQLGTVYFDHHPQPFRIGHFRSEPEGVAWLLDRS
ncbi:MAG TPA: hypothetical protein VHL57_05395, partial [Flavobacteriales bacterium]|nr:hypothetical protein [Flavobacteriales bacterium]